MVKACLDVAYAPTATAAAAVLFGEWQDARPFAERVWLGGAPPPYRSRRFSTRELAPLRELLARIEPSPEMVVVDGYVWLDQLGSPGLGGHLFAALGGGIPVVGVAKRPLAGAPALPVWRGLSRRPLWVSAAGVEVSWAAQQVLAMHGPYRLPTLLRRVDALARAGLAGGEKA